MKWFRIRRPSIPMSAHLRAGPTDDATWQRELHTGLDRIGVHEGEEFIVAKADPQYATIDAEGLPAFARGSETSRKAAVAQVGRVGTKRREVFECVRQHSKPTMGGVTREEIGDLLRMSDDTVRPRVKELIDGGWVRETDRTRRTRLGNDATVLEVTGKDPNAPAVAAAVEEPPEPEQAELVFPESGGSSAYDPFA